MKRPVFALIPALVALTACAQPPEIVARESVEYIETIGFDLSGANGAEERVAGLTAAHQETIYRRNQQAAAGNVLMSAGVAAAAGYLVTTAPTTSTIIHKNGN